MPAIKVSQDGSVMFASVLKGQIGVIALDKPQTLGKTGHGMLATEE